MKRILITAAIPALVALALPAFADEAHTPDDGWNEGGGEQDEALGLTPDHENGIYTYEVCSACHQLNGWGLTNGTFPQISGQHPNVIIKQLARKGFSRIILAVNHQADILRAYFGDGSQLGVSIEYSLETKPLGTMGPLHLMKDLPENFIVMNGDIGESLIVV